MRIIKLRIPKITHMCLAGKCQKKTDIMLCHLKPSCHTDDLEDPKCHVKKCACVCAYVNIGCCKGLIILSTYILSQYS